MNLSSGITSLLVSATAIVIVQADAVVAQGLEASEIENIAAKITVIIVSKNPLQPNQLVYRGSGVIIGRKGNSYYVLTNAHVVNTREPYQIRGPGKTQSERRTYNAEVMEKNEDRDLALLKFTSSRSYGVAEIGYDASLSRDSSVYVMGWRKQGEGARRYFTRGRIRGFFDNLLRYTNETHDGMSGGPVLNQRGRLVGIHKGLRAENQSEREGISLQSIMEFIERVTGQPTGQPDLPSCNVVLWGPCK